MCVHRAHFQLAGSKYTMRYQSQINWHYFETVADRQIRERETKGYPLRESCVSKIFESECALREAAVDDCEKWQNAMQCKA